MLMTLDEVAKFLKVGTTTVLKLRKEGKLPAVKIGKSLRFQAKDVETLVSSLLTVPSG